MVQRLCRGEDNSEKVNTPNNTEATAEILVQFMIFFLRAYEHQHVKNTTPGDNSVSSLTE